MDELIKKCRCSMTEEEKKEDSRLKQNERNRAYYNRNKETFKKNHSIYYSNNKDKINLKLLQWRDENKDKIKETKKEYYKNNKNILDEKHSLLMKTKVLCDICQKNYSYSYIKRHISHTHPDEFMKKYNFL
jgi:hypothetical protein